MDPQAAALSAAQAELRTHELIALAAAEQAFSADCELVFERSKRICLKHLKAIEEVGDEIERLKAVNDPRLPKWAAEHSLADVFSVLVTPVARAAADHVVEGVG